MNKTLNELLDSGATIFAAGRHIRICRADGKYYLADSIKEYYYGDSFETAAAGFLAYDSGSEEEFDKWLASVA